MFLLPYQNRFFNPENIYLTLPMWNVYKEMVQRPRDYVSMCGWAR
jgi:hypothetical protein